MRDWCAEFPVVQPCLIVSPSLARAAHELEDYLLLRAPIKEVKRLLWDTSGNQHGTLLLSTDSAESLARGVGCYYFQHVATEGDRVTIENNETRKRYVFTRGLLLHGGPNGHVTHLRFVRAFPVST